MTRHQKSLAILGSIALSITWVERSLVGRAVVASAQAASASQAGQGPEDEILNPQHTAVIVHEMLNDPLSADGSYDRRGRRYDPERTASIVAPMQKLLGAARANGVRVAYVRWTSHADGSTSSPTARARAAVASGQAPAPTPLGVEHTWGWEIIDDVKPVEGDWVLRKYRRDAFFGTILDPLLRWNGIKTIVFVGIGAEIGGWPTLMHASDLGYARVGVSDCILSSNPARMEDAMMHIGENATLKTSQEVIDIWNRAGAN